MPARIVHPYQNIRGRETQILGMHSLLRSGLQEWQHWWDSLSRRSLSRNRCIWWRKYQALEEQISSNTARFLQITKILRRMQGAKGSWQLRYPNFEKSCLCCVIVKGYTLDTCVSGMKYASYSESWGPQIWTKHAWDLCFEDHGQQHHGGEPDDAEG